MKRRRTATVALAALLLAPFGLTVAHGQGTTAPASGAPASGAPATGTSTPAATTRTAPATTRTAPTTTRTAPTTPRTTPAKPTTPPATARPAAPASLPPGQYKAEADAKAHCPGDTVVWANKETRIYHHAGERYYGRTKSGAFMCQKEAATSGFRAPRAHVQPTARTPAPPPVPATAPATSPATSPAATPPATTPTQR